MKSATFIHNYDVKCFHVVVQGTQTCSDGSYYFEDHMLIKRRWVDEKMNVIGRMCKDEKNEVIVKNILCLHF